MRTLNRYAFTKCRCFEVLVTWELTGTVISKQLIWDCYGTAITNIWTRPLQHALTLVQPLPGQEVGLDDHRRSPPTEIF